MSSFSQILCSQIYRLFRITKCDCFSITAYYTLNKISSASVNKQSHIPVLFIMTSVPLGQPGKSKNTRNGASYKRKSASIKHLTASLCVLVAHESYMEYRREKTHAPTSLILRSVYNFNIKYL